METPKSQHVKSIQQYSEKKILYESPLHIEQPKYVLLELQDGEQ